VIQTLKKEKEDENGTESSSQPSRARSLSCDTFRPEQPISSRRRHAATSVSNHEGISEHSRELVKGCDSLGADECCDLGRLASVKLLMSMEQPKAATIRTRLTQVLSFV
jgi:hypothetical protein